MGISVSTGLVSGTDYDALVTKLIAAESAPLTLMQTKEASYQSKLTAYGTIKSAFSTFQSTMQNLGKASTYQSMTATVADKTVASISATSSATNGSYSLQVSQLAQAQKLVTAGQASQTAAIGTGTITIDFGTISGGALNSTTGKYTGATFASSGSGTKTITIDSSNNTLQGIRDAINNAGIGVTASIVNDGSGTPYRLTLSGQNTGESNSVKISVSDTSGTGLSTLLNYNPGSDSGQALTQTAAAQNAKLTVDGISVSKTSNTITDVISGATLTLLSTNNDTGDSPTTVTVSRDTAGVTEAVNSFVSAYNTLVSTIDKATAYDSSTKTSATLNGESSLRNIETQLRSLLSKTITGSGSGFSNLTEVGVGFEKDGTMSVDSTKLQKALSTNFSGFAGLFAADGKITDSLISYTSASSKTQPGTYAVTVSQLATQGTAVASAAAGLTIDSTNDTLTVKLDGNTATVTLAQKTYASASELAAEIQSKINGASTFSKAESTVTVSESNGVLALTSKRYGSASNISITGGSGQSNLGLGSSATLTTGLDVAGTINGVAASGSGQTLTGATGDASEGLKIAVNGGSLGSRGTVSFAQGYAYQLDAYMTTVLADKGPIEARIDGLNDTIKDLQDDEDAFSTRLKTVEANYRAQFTALETLLSNLSSTDSYLTNALDSISSISKQSTGSSS